MKLAKLSTVGNVVCLLILTACVSNALKWGRHYDWWGIEYRVGHREWTPDRVGHQWIERKINGKWVVVNDILNQEGNSHKADWYGYAD